MTRTDLSRRALLAAAAAGIAQAALAAPRAAAYPKVDAFLRGYVESGKLAGAVVAIQRRKGPPLILAHGRVDPDPAAPAMDARTLVRIYSMTKPITGFAAMQLIDSGVLKLDQPIADILPAFSAPKVLVDPVTGATRPAAGPITVRHLLTHTAGLGYAINTGTPLAARYLAAGLTPGARTRAPGEGAWPNTLQDFAARLAQEPLAADPGAQWVYSVALDLLGAVIEKAAGAPFEEVLRTKVFAPLAMTDTAFFAPPEKAARLASVLGVSPQGVRVADPRAASPFLAPPAFPAGGAGLVSTAADYARFCAMWLNDGELDGVRLISRVAARNARSNLMPPGVTAEGKGAGFGAGLRVVLPSSAEPGAEPAGSVGWGGAAGTTFWIDPSTGMAVVFMAQFFPSSAYASAAEVRRAVYADRART